MGGVVNTAIVIAAAERVVSAKDAGMLREHSRYVQIIKTWAVSLLSRMGYVSWSQWSSGAGLAHHCLC